MVQMLLAEGMLLCSLFWAFCWLGTGSDEKNIRNFSTYPDEVQKIVKARPELSGNIRQRGPAAIFAGNLLLFTALLFAMGLLTRQEYFAGNFLNTLLLGQALNLFDFLVIDLLWWRHTKRVRFSGTEESPELYADPRKHFYAFLRGVLLFLAVALINGYLLTWIRKEEFHDTCIISPGLSNRCLHGQQRETLYLSLLSKSPGQSHAGPAHGRHWAVRPVL